MSTVTSTATLVEPARVRRPAAVPARKLDLRRILRPFLTASTREVRFVDVPLMYFLMVDGSGAPDTSDEYANAIGALYGVSYTLKFLCRRGDGVPPVDYPVMPLETLWWTAGHPRLPFTGADRAHWRWTAMLFEPSVVTDELFVRAREQVRARHPSPALDLLRLEPFQEGSSAQILHVGPYATEAPTIERLHEAIAAHGGRMVGRHHEIYLSDPRRTAPARLRTIVRQPYV